MLTYTNLIADYKILTKDASADNVTVGNMLLMEGTRRVLNFRPWKFLEETYTTVTVADQQFYNLPYNFKKLSNLTVTISTSKYIPNEVPSRDYWDRLNSVTNVSSDTPSHYFIFNNQVGLYPIPATAGNTITMNIKKRVKDVLTADYTTGTVTVTNDNATVTGASTSWTALMIGRFFKDNTNGEWYRITAVASTTSLTLASKYQGVTAATENYTIGDVGLIPEDFQRLPLWSAVSVYWYTIGDNMNKGNIYNKLFEDGLLEIGGAFGDLSENISATTTGLEFKNHNLYIKDVV